MMIAADRGPNRFVAMPNVPEALRSSTPATVDVGGD